MKVFLSHNHRTEVPIDRLSAKLAAAGIALVDDGAIQPGEDWAAAIEREVKGADALVLVVEPGAAQDPRLRREWQSAIDECWSTPDKPVIPVLLGETQLPGFLQDRQGVTVAGEDDWNRVVELIAASLNRKGNHEPPMLAPTQSDASAKRKERLSQIAQEATRLEPSIEEVTKQIELLRQRIRKARDDPSARMELAEMHIELADALKRLGQGAAALPELEAATEILAKLPDAARRLARVRTNVATLLTQLGQKQAARVQLESARDLYLKLEGAESLATLATRGSLVALLRELGDTGAAEREQEALASGAKKAVEGFAGRIFPPIGRFVGRLFGSKDERS